MPARIMVVDDELDLAAIMKTALERAGFVVDAFCDPVEALSSFRPGVYSLILMDVGMEKMSGFELYEKLRNMDDKLKVCFITAYDVEYLGQFRTRFPDLPLACFIKKPISMRSLVDTIIKELRVGSEESGKSIAD